MTLSLSEALSRVPFLQGIGQEAHDQVVAAGYVHAVPADTTLFWEGEEGLDMYVILDGAVQILRDKVELARLGEGAYFGDMALLDGGARSATVHTLQGPCRLFVLDRQAFLDVVSSSKVLLSSVLQGLSNRVRASNDQFYEAALRKQRIQAESRIARLRSVSEMVAGVAHEVNTPLGIINQAASYICDELQPREIDELAAHDEAREVLTDVADACVLILRNVKRASHLVRSFKNLSAREVVDVLENVELGAVIEEVRQLASVSTKGSGLTVVVRDECIGGSPWRGYPGHVEQILLNLISNCQRYAYPDGGGTLTITLTASESMYHLSARDEGRGIRPADLERLFEPFFTTGRSTGGTGLGLAIVHNLVTNSLGGTITVRSAVGEGTTFDIHLPLEVAPLAQESSRV